MLIPLSQIQVDNNWNVRTSLTEIEPLADSIRVDGILCPLTVTEAVTGGYTLIAGFRRFAAVKHLGWESVECHIVTATEEQARRKNVMENLARLDLNPLEEAQGMAALCPASAPIKAVCAAMGRSPSWVSQRRYLLRLPPRLQQKFATRELCISRVYSLCKASDPKAAAAIIEGRTLSRRNYQPVAPQVKRKRKEIATMTSHLLGCGITGLAPRLLAWVNGGVETEVMRAEIEAAGRAPT